MYKFRRSLFPLVGWILFFWSVGTAQAQFSEAQQLLFDHPHLQGIETPQTLHYSVEQSGPEAFSDTIDVTVDRVREDGKKDLSFRFLSEERALDFPPMEEFSGNPLLILFLQWDVMKMERQLGGHQNYFRNRLRQAFLERAKVTETEFMLGDQRYPARQVRMEPFVGDQHRNQLGAQEFKIYELVISDQLPGGIALMRTLVGARGEEAAQETVLRYTGTSL